MSTAPGAACSAVAVSIAAINSANSGRDFLIRHGGLSAFSKGDFDLIDALDLERVVGFGDKENRRKASAPLNQAMH